eukprot:Skav201600  [mRNA]  locus=scaffold152:812712:816023:+ [translate_table: standard]
MPCLARLLGSEDSLVAERRRAEDLERQEGTGALALQRWRRILRRTHGGWRMVVVGGWGWDGGDGGDGMMWFDEIFNSRRWRSEGKTGAVAMGNLKKMGNDPRSVKVIPGDSMYDLQWDDDDGAGTVAAPFQFAPSVAEAESLAQRVATVEKLPETLEVEARAVENWRSCGRLRPPCCSSWRPRSSASSRRRTPPAPASRRAMPVPSTAGAELKGELEELELEDAYSML